jgi:hypothetical protein
LAFGPVIGLVGFLLGSCVDSFSSASWAAAAVLGLRRRARLHRAECSAGEPVRQCTKLCARETIPASDCRDPDDRDHRDIATCARDGFACDGGTFLICKVFPG